MSGVILGVTLSVLALYGLIRSMVVSALLAKANSIVYRINVTEEEKIDRKEMRSYIEFFFKRYATEFSLSEIFKIEADKERVKEHIKQMKMKG